APRPAGSFSGHPSDGSLASLDPVPDADRDPRPRRQDEVGPRSEPDQADALSRLEPVSRLDLANDPARDEPRDLAHAHRAPGPGHHDVVPLVGLARPLVER